MSYKQASGAAALLQRRSEWVASLRESLPHFTEATASPLQQGSRAAVFNHNERHVLDDAVKSSLLLLPTDWREEATRRLAHTLHGIVEPQTLRQCDYFLCSLIHPTYVRASTMPSKKKEESQQRRIQQQLRRTVCMPLELTMTGSKSLRLLREVGGVVEAGQSSFFSRRAGAGEQDSAPGPRGGGGSSSSGGRVSGAIQYELEATWPELKTANTRACLSAFCDAKFDALVLYDRQAFPAVHPSASTAAEAGRSVAVPAEVSLSAFTALCGSIELVAGWASLVHYLDRVARQHGS